MRLLNVETLELQQFTGDDVPPYTILSHTWGKEEVTYQDLTRGDYQHMEGYQKLAGCCRLSRQDGYQYTWIDTCCIDKSSSAELSEAINSMFRWYQRSAICYAYLSDVALGKSTIGSSKWMRRGWTLQELLAPNTVVFLASTWDQVGSKTDPDVAWQIASESSIDIELLLARRDISLGITERLRRYSIAQKLLWAARRETTRKEDHAYCLLGIFEVNMPLLYGEGDKAFLRLQQEIMKESNDSSIFTWQYTDEESRKLYSGLLANSISCFQKCDVTAYPFPKIKIDSRTPSTIVYETLKNTIRLRASMLGTPRQLVSRRKFYNDSILCRMNSWSVPQGQSRDFTLSQFYVRHQPANDPGFRERFHDLEIVMLDCRDALGRVGFLARRTEDGELERCHMLALMYLHDDHSSLPVASWHHFLTYRHDDSSTTLSRPGFWRVISSLDIFGYDTEVSSQLKQEGALNRKSWIIINQIPGWHYLSFRQKTPENWPTIIFVFQTKPSNQYPGVACFNCVVSEDINSPEDALLIKEGRILLGQYNQYTFFTGELRKEVNSETILVIKVRQALSGMTEISLHLEHCDNAYHPLIPLAKAFKEL